MNAATALKPENLRQTFKAVTAKVRQMTWLQFFAWIIILLLQVVKLIGYGGYLLLMTIFRFAYFLTMPAKDDDEKPELPQENHHPAYSHPILPEFHHTRVGADVFGLTAEHLPPKSDSPVPPEHDEHIPNGHIPTINIEHTHDDTSPSSPKTPTPPGSDHKAPSIYESIGQAQLQQLPSEPENQIAGIYEPKIAEQNVSRSRGSLMVRKTYTFGQYSF